MENATKFMPGMYVICSTFPSSILRVIDQTYIEVYERIDLDEWEYIGYEPIEETWDCHVIGNDEIHSIPENLMEIYSGQITYEWR